MELLGKGPLVYASGDLEENIQRGKNKQIIWDVLKEKKKLSGNLLFKVQVTSSICGHLIIDYAGQTYNTVKIGKQCWMKENLNVGKKINGKNEMQNNSIIEKYCYDNRKSNCSKYGGLYQWDEMMQYSTRQGSKGICPEDWHIPTDNEWTVLINFLGGENVTGGKMKETGKIHWNSSSTGVKNKSGFTALLGGTYYRDGSFYYIGHYGNWWSSTEPSSSIAWYQRLYYNNNQVHQGDSDKTNGFSVRCLKD